MRIGMTLSHLEYEYSQRLLEGVKRYIQETKNDFLVFSSEEPESNESEFAYQEWAVSKFLNRQNLDGVIIPTATLSRFVTEKVAHAMVKEIDRKLPVVSIVSPVENIPSLIIDSEKAFKNLVRHMIEEHQRKRLLIIAIDAESEDIRQRLRFFKEVLAEKNLELPDSHILYASYTVESAVDVLASRYPDKESIDFDAVVCVIDELAMGAIKYFFELGVSVPEEVCVSGFDNTLRSIYSYPSLTTIDQNIPDQTYTAAKLLTDRINGKKIDMLNTIYSRCCFRVSCGCLDQGSKYICKTDSGELVPKDRDFYSTAYNSFFVHNMQNAKILDFIDDLHSGITLENLSYRLNRYMKYFNIGQSAICLYRAPVEINRHQGFVLPAEARVFYASDEKTGEKIINSTEYFDCSEKLLPGNMLDKFKGMHVVRILYNGNLQYGYMIVSTGNYGSTEYMMIYSLIAKLVSSAWEVSSLEEKNKRLSMLSKTDELTGLLNRRGFMFLGQQSLSIAVDSGKSGLVIYGDMDGLKSINDTFGHEAGDRAILAEVELLKKTFRAADTIGRLGGDEFAIVSISLSLDVFERLKQRLDSLCEEWNNTTTEPFRISISLGAAVFDCDNFNLEALLDKADEEQYKVKKLKKASRR